MQYNRDAFIKFLFFFLNSCLLCCRFFRSFLFHCCFLSSCFCCFTCSFGGCTAFFYFFRSPNFTLLWFVPRYIVTALWIVFTYVIVSSSLCFSNLNFATTYWAWFIYSYNKWFYIFTLWVTWACSKLAKSSHFHYHHSSTFIALYV